MIAKDQAYKLWDDLRNLLRGAQSTITDIIATKAWEPLGYSTFAEAWADKMADITIARELRAHVICQLLSEGLTTDEVAKQVKGTGPTAVAYVDQQRKTGVPAEKCSIVRRHMRHRPSKPDTLHVRVGETMLAEYQRVAKCYGATVEEIAKEAIRERFADIVTAGGQKRRS